MIQLYMHLELLQASIIYVQKRIMKIIKFIRKLKLSFVRNQKW